MADNKRLSTIDLFAVSGVRGVVTRFVVEQLQALAMLALRFVRYCLVGGFNFIAGFFRSTPATAGSDSDDSSFSYSSEDESSHSSSPSIPDFQRSLSSDSCSDSSDKTAVSDSDSRSSLDESLITLRKEQGYFTLASVVDDQGELPAQQFAPIEPPQDGQTIGGHYLRARKKRE